MENKIPDKLRELGNPRETVQQRSHYEAPQSELTFHWVQSGKYMQFLQYCIWKHKFCQVTIMNIMKNIRDLLKGHHQPESHDNIFDERLQATAIRLPSYQEYAEDGFV